MVGSNGLGLRLPINRYQRGSHIDGGRQGARECHQSGERNAEHSDHFPMAAYDLRVKGEWPLEFSGIAQPGVRLPYGYRIGHALGSVLAANLDGSCRARPNGSSKWRPTQRRCPCRSHVSTRSRWPSVSHWLECRECRWGQASHPQTFDPECAAAEPLSLSSVDSPALSCKYRHGYG